MSSLTNEIVERQKSSGNWEVFPCEGNLQDSYIGQKKDVQGSSDEDNVESGTDADDESGNRDGEIGSDGDDVGDCSDIEGSTDENNEAADEAGISGLAEMDVLLGGDEETMDDKNGDGTRHIRQVVTKRALSKRVESWVEWGQRDMESLYDPAFYYSSAEMKARGYDDMDVPALVEKPHLYILGRCSAKEVEQLGYVDSRRECLDQLTNNLQTNRCRIVWAGPAGRRKRNGIKPFKDMTVSELKIECAARGLDVDERLKKELQQNLKDHLKGVQRVPALLINEQDKSMKDINLDAGVSDSDYREMAMVLAKQLRSCCGKAFNGQQYLDSHMKFKHPSSTAENSHEGQQHRDISPNQKEADVPCSVLDDSPPEAPNDPIIVNEESLGKKRRGNEGQRNDKGPPLHHFGSRTLQSEEQYLRDCWNECLAEQVTIPHHVLKIYDEDGNLQSVQHTGFLEDDDDNSDSIAGAECDPLVNRTLDNSTNDNDQEDEEEEKVVDLQQVGEDLMETFEEDNVEIPGHDRVLLYVSQDTMLKTTLAENVSKVLGDTCEVRTLDKMRMVSKNNLKGKEGQENYETALAVVQLKVLAKHSTLKRQFQEWEQGFFAEHDCNEPTEDDIRADIRAHELYKTLRLCKQLLQHWNITVHLYTDMVPRFGRNPTELCLIFNTMINFIYDNHKYRLRSWDLFFLQPDQLHSYAEAVHRLGAPLRNCFGFIDGTVHGIARPHENQRVMYNGHKRIHSIKFQSVVIPNGLIANLHGPFEGNRHDSTILQQSGILNELRRVAFYNGDPLCLYGDPAYPLGLHLQAPFKNIQLTPQMLLYNTAMSEVRVAVEWLFGLWKSCTLYQQSVRYHDRKTWISRPPKHRSRPSRTLAFKTTFNCSHARIKKVISNILPDLDCTVCYKKTVTIANLCKFSLDEWSNVECKRELRFAKKDLLELSECLGIPEKITCNQRTVCGVGDCSDVQGSRDEDNVAIGTDADDESGDRDGEIGSDGDDVGDCSDVEGSTDENNEAADGAGISGLAEMDVSLGDDKNGDGTRHIRQVVTKRALSKRVESWVESRVESRVEWGQRDMEVIEEALEDFRKVPQNQEIRNLFLFSSELRDILKRNDFQRIRNKVKNTFKKMKRY
ncbi:hypothetical protein AWC38_SpisGene11812 [Stylophora pistillata]|uniref:SAP domain-containing protein n=1 Tax=Stylophora pistillata TaxID=50429 RepID=A0A2B4S4B9_STYPI|nr:hypothetical protein AWC38_SpisGene11812 [Stylophora pistillata]